MFRPCFCGKKMIIGSIVELKHAKPTRYRRTFLQPLAIPQTNQTTRYVSRAFAGGYRKRRKYHERPPRYDDLADIHHLSKLALERAGLTRMTEIQAKTWQHARLGKDIIGRSRTGTGKTMAFLLPAFESIMEQPRDDKRVSVLILSPTRELAFQTSEQAKMLCRSYGGDITCITLVGGTNVKYDMPKLSQEGVPDILVATPGRLLGHMKISYHGDIPFRTLFEDLRMLVIDEADTMLQLGFLDDILDLLSYCSPADKRQTMLFSATLDDGSELAQHATKPDYVLIDCVGNAVDDDETGQSIPNKVHQSYVIAPPDRIFSAPIEIIVELMDNSRLPKRKLIVFFPTIKQVLLYEFIFNNHLGRRVFAIHSQMDQSSRTNASNLFQHAQSGVLLTTDASARGVDYKDITHVIQIGIPSDRKTYIHRLGRTARAGKRGDGLLVLTSLLEEPFLDQALDGLDLHHDSSFQSLLNDPMHPFLEDEISNIIAAVRDGRDHELEHSIGEACSSMEAYYESRKSDLGDSSDNLKTSFLRQAGVSSRPRMDVPLRNPWSPGDRFDVGAPIIGQKQVSENSETRQFSVDEDGLNYEVQTEKCEEVTLDFPQTPTRKDESLTEVQAEKLNAGTPDYTHSPAVITGSDRSIHPAGLCTEGENQFNDSPIVTDGQLLSNKPDFGVKSNLHDGQPQGAEPKQHRADIEATGHDQLTSADVMAAKVLDASSTVSMDENRIPKGGTKQKTASRLQPSEKVGSIEGGFFAWFRKRHPRENDE